MRLYSGATCLRRSAASSMYSHSNQFQGGVTQSMVLWKCSRPQSSSSHMTSGFVNFSPNKNIRSSEPQRLKYFVSLVGRRLRCGLSTREGSLNVKLDVLSREGILGINWNWRGINQKIGATAGGLCFGFSVSGTVKADLPVGRNINCSETSTPSTHGKEVYTDYSVTGIPGDGRCLFRSVVHGACVRSGKDIPNEDLQRKLADELRSMVADEFVTRRDETEWFIEGDFDTYVSQIRQPHVWGGEPELFMASHVLQMPITVYMRDEDAGGLISIAEYGQEYGKEDPVQLLYHGFGHYDSLQIRILVQRQECRILEFVIQKALLQSIDGVDSLDGVVCSYRLIQDDKRWKTFHCLDVAAEGAQFGAIHCPQVVLKCPAI